MTALKVNISGTTLEIRIVEVRAYKWRWALCAVDTPHPSGREQHRAAWGGTAATAAKAFDAAMSARKSVQSGEVPAGSGAGEL